MAKVDKQSLMIYGDLNINERINLRSQYQDSAFRRENYGGVHVPMMSVRGIAGAIHFAITWGWYWC